MSRARQGGPVLALALATLMLVGCNSGAARGGAGIVREGGGAIREGAGAVREGAGAVREGAGAGREAGGAVEGAVGAARGGGPAAQDAAAAQLASRAEEVAVREGRTRATGEVRQKVVELLSWIKAESDDLGLDAKDACEVKGLVDAGNESSTGAAAQEIVKGHGGNATAAKRVEDLADKLLKARTEGALANVAVDALCEVAGTVS